MVPTTRSVRRRFFLRVPPKRVFRAITDPRWLVRWLCETAELSPRDGSPYRLVFPGGWEHRGTIARYERGKSITFRWAWKGVALRNTRLRFSVQARRGGSLLTVVHSGFPRTERWVDLYGVTEWGWTYYAMNLKSVLETGQDLRSPMDG